MYILLSRESYWRHLIIELCVGIFTVGLSFAHYTQQKSKARERFQVVVIKHVPAICQLITDNQGCARPVLFIYVCAKAALNRCTVVMHAARVSASERGKGKS